MDSNINPKFWKDIVSYWTTVKTQKDTEENQAAIERLVLSSASAIQIVRSWADELMDEEE